MDYKTYYTKNDMNVKHFMIDLDKKRRMYEKNALFIVTDCILRIDMIHSLLIEVKQDAKG